MRPLAALAGLLLLAGCAGGGAPGCGAGLTPSTGLTAMFGLTLPGGGMVTPEAWRRFEEAELTPRFPDGYTVSEARGSWRNRRGEIIAVPTRIFFVLAPAAGSGAAQAGLQAAIGAWLRQTGQEAVGLLVQPGCTAGLF